MFHGKVVCKSNEAYKHSAILDFILLSIPMLIQMFAMPFHWMMPAYNWIALITTTIIMAISAFPYWKSAIAAFKKHSANMNTLVATGTAVAYFYSILR